jgi:hypothetical protein
MRKIAAPVALTIVLFLPILAYSEGDGFKEVDVSAHEFSARESPQMWSMEVKTGFWLPGSGTVEQFFGKCCNMISQIEGGLLFKGRYGVEQSVGFFYKDARAVGVNSGAASQDRFNFILIPMATSFLWRADYFDWRYLVPFARMGLDYIFFREGDRGSSTKGIKFGLHGGGGVALNIGAIGDVNDSFDSDFGINDLFLTLETRYQWANNFGGRGLNLSGWVHSAGLLFEF